MAIMIYDNISMIVNKVASLTMWKYYHSPASALLLPCRL